MKVQVNVQLKVPEPERPRFEMKMVTERHMLSRVHAWLRAHPFCFYERHPPRRVNNVYFDTPHMHRFVENLGGTSERRKVRLRWYGERTSNVKGVFEIKCKRNKTPFTSNVKGVFEIKCKRNKLGWKISQKLTNRLDLQNQPWSEILAAVRSELGEELRLHLDTSGPPVLINRYEREYYVSSDGIVRVTLDHGLRVFDQRHKTRPNLLIPVPIPDELVIELKAPSNRGDSLREAIEGIPLRVTKRSKYALGVASILGY